MQLGSNFNPVTLVQLVRNLVAYVDAREGKWRGNWRIEWVASTLTPPPNVVYPALPKLLRTPRLPVVDTNSPPTDLNGLVRFGERRNLVSAHVPSRSARAIPHCVYWVCMSVVASAVRLTRYFYQWPHLPVGTAEHIWGYICFTVAVRKSEESLRARCVGVNFPFNVAESAGAVTCWTHPFHRFTQLTCFASVADGGDDYDQGREYFPKNLGATSEVRGAGLVTSSRFHRRSSKYWASPYGIESLAPGICASLMMTTMMMMMMMMAAAATTTTTMMMMMKNVWNRKMSLENTSDRLLWQL